MNKQYARTNYAGCKYITAGKLYPVQNLDGSTFETIDDEGDLVKCWLRDCPHLDDNDWEIIEEKEQMNILTAKQAKQTAVMDWAEEMSDRGYWVDLSWDADVRRCVAKVGKAGHSRALMSASGGTEITARIELMKAWDAIIANRRANLEVMADEIGCSYTFMTTKGISDANSDERNRALFELWARNEYKDIMGRTRQASKIADVSRRMLGENNE